MKQEFKAKNGDTLSDLATRQTSALARYRELKKAYLKEVEKLRPLEDALQNVTLELGNIEARMKIWREDWQAAFRKSLRD